MSCHGDDPGTPLRIRHTEHDDLLHSQGPVDDPLELCDVDIDPARDDDVVDPAAHLEPPSDPRPTVGGEERPPFEHRGGCLRIEPVAGERRGAVERDASIVVTTYGMTETCGGVVYD